MMTSLEELVTMCSPGRRGNLVAGVGGEGAPTGEEGLGLDAVEEVGVVAALAELSGDGAQFVVGSG